MTESNNPRVIFIDTNIWIYANRDGQFGTDKPERLVTNGMILGIEHLAHAHYA